MKLKIAHLPRAKLEAIAESVLESDTSMSMRAFRFARKERDFTVVRVGTPRLDTPTTTQKGWLNPAVRKNFSADRVFESKY